MRLQSAKRNLEYCAGAASGQPKLAWNGFRAVETGLVVGILDASRHRCEDEKYVGSRLANQEQVRLQFCHPELHYLCSAGGRAGLFLFRPGPRFVKVAFSCSPGARFVERALALAFRGALPTRWHRICKTTNASVRLTKGGYVKVWLGRSAAP